MPTRHKRHSVTETPEVTRALAPLRERLGEVKLRELIVLGAHEKLRELERDHADARQARQRLAQRVLQRRSGGDAELADRVRREGWSRA